MTTHKDPDKRTVKLGTGNTTSYTEESCAPIAKKSSLSLFEGENELIMRGPPREVTEGERVMALKAMKAIRERDAFRDALTAKENDNRIHKVLSQAEVAELLEKEKSVPKDTGKTRVCRAVKDGILKVDPQGKINKNDARDWVDNQPEKQSKGYNPLDVPDVD